MITTRQIELLSKLFAIDGPRSISRRKLGQIKYSEQLGIANDERVPKNTDISVRGTILFQNP